MAVEQPEGGLEGMGPKISGTVSVTKTARGMGFWFITGEDGKDYSFTHLSFGNAYNLLAPLEAFSAIPIGARVTFNADNSSKFERKNGVAHNVVLNIPQESEAIERQEKSKEKVAWIILKSTESIEGMKDKLKWTISQLIREHGMWQITSDGKIYDFDFSHCSDMWDWDKEAFNNLNKDDTVLFDAAFGDRFKPIAMNIRVIDEVPQESKAIEQ